MTKYSFYSYSCIMFLISRVYTLSWMCNYNSINGPVGTHVLYKEDNINQVKWLEKNEYCRAKGDLSVYPDAGQGKCEYSRNICLWNSSKNNCILNTSRENDQYNECVNLLRDNVLVDNLDNGRILKSINKKTKVQSKKKNINFRKTCRL